MDDMTDKCVCTENLSGPATVAGCDCGCDGDVASGKPKGRSLFGKGVSCIVCALVFVPCVIFALLLMYGMALGVWAVWDSFGGHRYEFELKISDSAPDFNQHVVVFVNVDTHHTHWYPYGYSLYRDSMRDNGMNSLILIDRMASEADVFFGGSGTSTYFKPFGSVGFFGELPQKELSSQLDLVRAVQELQPVKDALAAIDANAVFQFRNSSGEKDDFEMLRRICDWSGIGPYWDLWGGWIGREIREGKNEAKCAAKEALTACAIKSVFPNLQMPKIVEKFPVEEEIVMMHGRAPFPVHVKVPTQRTFDFYFAEGGSFASLSIKLAYDRFNRNTLEEKVKKHEAIFRQVFSELKTASGKTIIRGQSYYDAASGTGIIRNLVRVKDERGRGR